MQQARGLALLAPHTNTMPTPLPVSVLSLPHLPDCLCPPTSSSHASETGEPPSPLPLLGSVPVTTLPLKHSYSDVAVAVRLSQMTGQNSGVTSAELLENWTLPRTPGTGIRKQNISLALCFDCHEQSCQGALTWKHCMLIHTWLLNIIIADSLFSLYLSNTLKKTSWWYFQLVGTVGTKALQIMVNKKKRKKESIFF